MFLAPADTVTGPRYTVVGWAEDGQSIYLQTASRTRWERGLARYDRRTKALQQLVSDGGLYGSVRIARSGSRAVLSVAEGNRPADLFAADGGLGGLVRLVEGNPPLTPSMLARTELISYLDVDGRRQYGVVYYPPDYSAKPWPTVFYVYEQFFDDSFEAISNVLAGAGYVVARPSVSFETGHPGEAWLKGVLNCQREDALIFNLWRLTRRSSFSALLAL